MDFRLSITKEKPSPHLALDDWRDRVSRMRNVSAARQADTYAIRNSSRQLRNESQIESEWANYESKNALTTRVEELTLWWDLIRRAFERLENKALELEAERRAIEEELHMQMKPLSILSQILTARDSRLLSELTHDNADFELKNELYLLENNQRLLKEIGQHAWEKMRRLDIVCIKIRQELKNKKDTEIMEKELLALDKASPNITYKLEPLRNPRSCCSYDIWLEHTKNIKKLAENELADASALKDTLASCRTKSHCILKGQQERTCYTLRLRIMQTQQAANELEWQQQRLQEDLGAACCEIESLEAELMAKKSTIMLAETRLETRSMRCVTELCLDSAHQMLCKEVEKLREIRNCLLNKINESKANFNLLSEHAKKIDADLENKRHTLKTDRHALKSYEDFLEGTACLEPHNPNPQTDFNIKVANVELPTAK
ncbi:hypothetical protein KR222_001611 [Zaprionus bogoriensis]|nr:hypothetical protein KR222_001611 [Zaprionus bogoriensis]